MPSDPPPSQVDGLPETPKAFRVFAIAVNEGPPEKMLKEFDRLYEAKAFMRFLEKGGAFTQVRVEKVQVEAKAAPWKKGSRERKYGSKPGGLTKLIFFIGLLLSLGGGLVLGIFLASTLEGDELVQCAYALHRAPHQRHVDPPSARRALAREPGRGAPVDARQRDGYLSLRQRRVVRWKPKRRI